jgi:hypothetical protein
MMLKKIIPSHYKTKEDKEEKVKLRQTFHMCFEQRSDQVSST